MQQENKKRSLLLGLCALALAAGLVWLLLWANTCARRLQAEGGEAGGVRINEVMASNGAYPNADGVLCDWVELYNSASGPCDLSGWGLSDNARSVKYTFPDGTVLPAGAYLVVSCMREAPDDGYAPFGISADGGETVCLFNADSVAENTVTVPALGRDQAYAYDAGTWEIRDWATPGYENTRAGYTAYRAGLGTDDTTVRITEVMAANKTCLPDADGDFSDWLELTNTGSAVCDLTGYWLSDDPDAPYRWALPALTLAPGERAVIFCSGKNRTGAELHTGFSLSRSGGTVLLTSPAGAETDRLVWPALEDDQAACPGADGETVCTWDATPGFDNTAAGREQFLAASDSHGALVINEVMSANGTLLQQTDGKCYDWVELKNVSDQTITLSEYTLTTNAAHPDLYRLPDVTLEPGKLYVLLCSGDESLSNKQYAHTNFTLSAAGDRLYLYDETGALSDRAAVRGLPTGGSLGRLPGEAGFFLFSAPTPGAENGEGFRAQAETPLAGTAQGVYNDVTALSVALTGEGTIHYTLDGSVPTAKSEVYAGPFALTATTVLRAVSVADGKAASETATYTYIINENHDLPVASLVCDPEAMFGGEDGVYNNYDRDQECDGVLSFFEEGGGFEAGCVVKLHGLTSREVRNKKSFKVQFKPRLGGALVYDVFQNGEASRYDALLLRAGTVKYMSIMRDEVAAEVANTVSDNTLALDVRYCVLYINGQYWGLYALREAFSSQYVANHTGSSPDSAVIARAPVLYRDGGHEDLFDLFQYIENCGMNTDEEYEYAAARFDMAALADWMVLEGYFNNDDVAGNIRYLKGDGTDGRWRIAFFDLDLGLQNGSAGWFKVFEEANQIGRLTSILCGNDKFRALLIERMAYLLSHDLNSATVQGIIDDFGGQIDSEVERDSARWEGSVQVWQWNWQSLHDWFGPERALSCVATLTQYVSLTDAERQTLYAAALEGSP